MTHVPEQLFDPIPGDPLAERAANQIENHILNGLLKDGAKLPGERELALQLDISRPKLREALQLLEERGLICIVAGEGAFVSDLSGPAMSPALIALYTRHPAALDDHLEYRRHQERLAARLAAQRATDADRQRLNGFIDEMKKAHANGDLARASELDSEFHTAIVEASYNRTLIHTMRSLYELNRSAMFVNRQELFKSASIGADLLTQHAAIAEAISLGDAEAAEARAMEHIDFVRDSLKRAFATREREAVAGKRRAV